MVGRQAYAGPLHELFKVDCLTRHRDCDRRLMDYDWAQGKGALHALPKQRKTHNEIFCFSICGVKISILATMQGVGDKVLPPCEHCIERLVSHGDG
jgi:hypothetical protein